MESDFPPDRCLTENEGQVSQYLKELDSVQFVERNETKARASRIGEEDVDTLISDYRRENLQTGR